MKSATIEEVTAKLQAVNPTLLFGIASDKGLIAVSQDGEWVPVMSAAINGQWVYLDGSLPLINGERVYSDSDFTAITNAPVECIGCRDNWLPSHNGSSRCESGSIASGGKNSHCTCDTCF